MSTTQTETRDFAYSEYVAADDGGGCAKCPVAHVFGAESDHDLASVVEDVDQRTGLLRVLSEYDSTLFEMNYDPWFVPEEMAEEAWVDAVETVDDEGFDVSRAEEVAEELGWSR